MIGKEELLKQIAVLEQQRVAGLRIVQNADGAIQLATFLLEKIRQEEDRKIETSGQ